MKKFVTLIVMLCTVMISSTAAADNLHHDEKGSSLFRDIMESASPPKEKIYPTIDTRGKTPIEPKLSESELNEQYRLVFTVALTAGLVVLFFAYKYFQSRQLIRERSFASWLTNFVGEKNFWLLIFCVVSLVTCVVYVPYNLVKPSNPVVTLKTAHATIFDAPKDFKPQLTKIDYEAIAFREVLILLGCCAGYTASTIIKKK